jgi:menaquinone-dependent protoporphyrinogen oxidase
MKRPSVLVAYATREGQTRRIAEHVAGTLRARGLEPDLVEVAHPPETLAVRDHAAAILAASVHLGKHEREMVEFARAHREELVRMPTAFLSVSGGQATIERAETPPDVRAQTEKDVKANIERFEKETGWHPDHVHAVAGAIAYSHYNIVVKLVLRRMMKKAGGPTDTSRDWEYTDYPALDGFVDEVVRGLGVGAAGPSVT